MITGHTAKQDELAHRQRRSTAWWAVTVAVHVLMPVLTVALLLGGRLEQIDTVVVIIALAMAPLVLAFWLQRRRPSAGKPQDWWWRSLFVAFPQAIALGFAVNGVLDKDAPAPWQRILLVLAIPLIPATTAALAGRSLLRPLVPALGAGDFEVLVEPRTGQQRPWFYGDSITLTDREIVISVRSGSGRATWNPTVQRIALDDVTAVGARPAVAQDGPWITLSDGRGLPVPPGEVVVIECRDVRRVLPVEHAAVFADVIRTRAGLPASPGTLGAERPATAHAAEPTHVPEVSHVPEVLPAPEPTGPPAHAVTGPATPPTSGPGMTARWVLGFPLALAGTVAVPVGLLWSAPPPPHRLVFAALWIAVAAGIWLRSWQQPRYWPVWALMAALGTALLVVIDGPGWALLGPIVAVLLTWAGRQVLLRPVGTDLAASRLEIPVRGSNVTLLVQPDRVVLKLSAGAGGAVPQAMPLDELTVVQPGQFAGNEVRWWPLPGALRTRLGRGPALRLVSGCRQWLVPTPATRELAAIIRARAGTAARPETHTLTATQWHELQSWAARQLTTSRRNGGLTQRTVGWRLAVALPAAFLGSGLLNEVIGRGISPFSTGAPAVGIVALAIAAVLTADWIRVRRRLCVAEDNALPPGSPAWGELRPDHAPLPGWQPWHQ